MGRGETGDGSLGEIRMKDNIKNNWKFLLFVLSSGLIGGYCIGLYLPEMYSQETLQQLQEQGMTTEMLALSGAVQYGIIYGLILAAVGVIISKKVRLWKEFRFDKDAVAVTAIIRSHDEIVLHVSAGTYYFETNL